MMQSVTHSGVLERILEFLQFHRNKKFKTAEVQEIRCQRTSKCNIFSFVDMRIIDKVPVQNFLEIRRPFMQGVG
jgi:hypothetical protein